MLELESSSKRDIVVSEVEMICQTEYCEKEAVWHPKATQVDLNSDTRTEVESHFCKAHGAEHLIGFLYTGEQERDAWVANYLRSGKMVPEDYYKMPLEELRGLLT